MSESRPQGDGLKGPSSLSHRGSRAGKLERKSNSRKSGFTSLVALGCLGKAGLWELPLPLTWC